jgi:hypothetical protein
MKGVPLAGVVLQGEAPDGQQRDYVSLASPAFPCVWLWAVFSCNLTAWCQGLASTRPLVERSHEVSG